MIAVDSIQDVLDQAYAQGGLPDEDGNLREFGSTAMRREQGLAIRALVAELGARRTLETGFAFGLSGLNMVAGMLEGGCEEPFHLAMDPTERSAWGNAGLEAFRTADAAGWLEFIENGSGLVLPELVSAGGEPFDLMLVDGGHLFETAFMDLNYGIRLLRPGGVIVLDDLWMPAVRWAMDYFVRNLGWEVVGSYPHQPTGAQRKTRRWGRRRKDWSTYLHVVLRAPTPPRQRPWDHFVPFGDLAR